MYCRQLRAQSYALAGLPVFGMEAALVQKPFHTETEDGLHISVTSLAEPVAFLREERDLRGRF